MEANQHDVVLATHGRQHRIVSAVLLVLPKILVCVMPIALPTALYLSANPCPSVDKTCAPSLLVFGIRDEPCCIAGACKPLLSLLLTCLQLLPHPHLSYCYVLASSVCLSSSSTFLSIWAVRLVACNSQEAGMQMAQSMPVRCPRPPSGQWQWPPTMWRQSSSETLQS